LAGQFHIARIRGFEASAQPWTLCVNLRTLHAPIAVLAPALFGIPALRSGVVPIA